MNSKQLTFGNEAVAIKVVGLKYGCKPVTGTTVKLVKDDENKFDEDAVMVVTMTGEKLVGFVANNRNNKGTLSNKFYTNFKSASDLRNLVDLDDVLVCGNLNVKGGYGLLKVTI